MPDTPNYAITYPCMGVPVTPADFNTFATDVEAALVAVDTKTRAVLNVPYAMANTASSPAFGVETIMTFSGTSGSGITIGASTFTALTAGLYAFGVNITEPNSTLTITSQRVAIYINGVFMSACKWRGTNPSDAFVQGGAYTSDLPVAVADVVTFRYLWTGTGALLSPPVTGFVSMTLLATP